MTTHAENQLSQHFRELVRLLLPAGSSPVWTEPLFVDDHRIDWEAKTVPEKALYMLTEFAPQFAELVDRNPAWIKFAAEGIWKQSLVVVVSASRTRSAVMHSSKNILFSGLPAVVAGDPSWNVERSLAVIR